jgi:hypothetical protein
MSDNPSVLASINGIIAALTADEDLAAFCRDHWGKELQAKFIYKKRASISMSEDLPIVMITRPGVDKNLQTIGADPIVIEKNHTVRFYCGFYQEDPVKAPVELLQFEELIESVLVSQGLIPGPSNNDEGLLHPVYFIVSDYMFGEDKEI